MTSMAGSPTRCSVFVTPGPGSDLYAINNRAMGRVREFIGMPVTSTRQVRSSGAAADSAFRTAMRRWTVTTLIATATSAATFFI